MLCFDDSDPPFPVLVCETKRPSHDLELDDVDRLETYMAGLGSADYGVLTDGDEFRLYEYDQDKRLTRAEVLNMPVPSCDDVVELMDEYLGDEERIGELERRFDELCGELDEKVLREAYGLDLEAEGVVDEFLQVW